MRLDRSNLEDGLAALLSWSVTLAITLVTVSCLIKLSAWVLTATFGFRGIEWDECLGLAVVASAVRCCVVLIVDLY